MNAQNLTIVYSSENIRCYLLLYYIDCILLACSDQDFLNKVKLHLCKHFKMKNLEKVNNFLGININRDVKNKTIKIDQISSIKRFNVEVSFSKLQLKRI